MNKEEANATEKDTINDAKTIPMDQPLRKFKEFLDLQNNKRIFFSGKFGSGKTFFLNEFFKNNKNDYEVYHLFPIRYQVLDNQDIIQLIKYDILISIFEKNPELQSAKAEGFQNWVKNFGECLDSREFMLAVPKIGRPLALVKDVL